MQANALKWSTDYIYYPRATFELRNTVYRNHDCTEPRVYSFRIFLLLCTAKKKRKKLKKEIKEKKTEKMKKEEKRKTKEWELEISAEFTIEELHIGSHKKSASTSGPTFKIGG